MPMTFQVNSNGCVLLVCQMRMNNEREILDPIKESKITFIPNREDGMNCKGCVLLVCTQHEADDDIFFLSFCWEIDDAF